MKRIEEAAKYNYAHGAIYNLVSSLDIGPKGACRYYSGEGGGLT